METKNQFEDAERNRKALLSILEDQRESEKKLRESEERFRLIAENTGDSIAVFDLNLNYIYLSPSCVNLLGYTSEELIKMSPKEIMTEDSWLKIQNILSLELKNEIDGSANPNRTSIIETEQIRKDGRIINVEANVSFIRSEDGKPVNIITISRDITEKKRLTKNLKASEEKFKKLFDEHSATKLLIEPETGRIVNANSAAEKYYGYTIAELEKMNISQIIIHSFDEILENMRKVSRNEKNSFEMKHLLKNGEIRDVEIFSSKVEIGGKYYIHFIIHDITDRKKAKELLEKSEERYGLVIEAIEQGLWDWDVIKNEVYYSPQWKKQIGYSDNELENKFETWLEHLHPEDRERTVRSLNDYLKNPQGYFEVEFRLRHKSGDYKFISNKAASIKDENNKVIRLFGAHTDITDAKRAELEEHERNRQINIQRKIIVETATSVYMQKGDVKNLSQEITEKVSTLLEIERVSVWIFDEEEKYLECIDLFEKSKNFHSSGYFLEEFQYQNEFEALKSSKYVDASEPLTDPRTAGYVNTYLIPLNITSMLDGVINESGKNFGTFCLEHVNKQHKWTQDEINFVSQIADQIAICLSNHKRLAAEERVRENEMRYRLIAENTADTIAVFDLNLVHTYVSPSAERLLGYSPEEVMKLGLKNILTAESYANAVQLIKHDLELEYLGKSDPNRYFTFASKEIRKDGKIIDVESIVSYIRDENGNATHLLTVSRDVTVQNQLKKELHESEEKFRSIFENSTIGIYRTTPDGKILLANPTMVKMLGYDSFEDLSKRDLNSEVFEPSYNRRDFINMFNNKSSVKGIESKWTRKDGSYIYVRESSRAIKNERGEILYFEGSVEDITEVKIAEERLKQSEERMRLIVEGTSYFFFYTHDTNGKINYISPSVEKITGHKVDKWLNQNHWFVTESPLNREAQKHTQAMMNGEKVANPFYLEIFNSQNEKILLELYEAPVYKDNKIIGLQGIAHDVTERSRLYEKIETLSSAIEQSPFSVVITDSEGNIQFVNPRFTEITGYSYAEAIGKNPRLLKSGFHDKTFYTDLWDSIKSGITWKGEICNKKKDNSFYWENAIISPVIDNHGDITHFVAIKEDITSQKELNDKLRKSEEEFRSVWENSIDAMRLLDEEGIIVNVNDAYCKLLGITKDKLIGKPFNVSYVMTDEKKSLDHYKEKFRQKKIERKYETQILLHNKNTIWVELTNSFIEIGNEKLLLLSILRNVTERNNLIHDLVKAREKAEASDKLKSEFLAQISHEIRSPLNVIINYNSLLKTEYGNLEKEEVEDAFNGISNSSQRIIRTIDLILNSSEMQLGTYSPIFETIDVFEKIVQKSYNEMKRLADSRKIDLRIEKLTNKTSAKCDEYSVFQSVINLVDNAIKYTKTGTIEISLQRDSKKRLQILVSDTGIGMSEEYMAKLFQPFSQEQTGYTRKFEGTGLGLSLVKKYCDLNNISIDVKSKKDVGTTFTLTFNS